ncbi:MAG: type II secretion system protein [Phycisphaerae bacterium]|nr:type II secretion system protein [Phycisphaerae bacterium]
MLCSMRTTPPRRGFTLIEVTVVIAIAAIPLLAFGILMSGSARAWNRIYGDLQSDARVDAYVVMASLQQFGRRSNLLRYDIYRITGSTFSKATPPSNQLYAVGQALEIWYWDGQFDPADPDAEILELDNTGTHYALYYLDGRQLKVDFGRVVNGVGGVRNNARHTANLAETRVLSENVNIQRNINIFNHAVSAGRGSGCINTDLILTDNNGITVEVKFSTLIRLAWPR